MIDRGYATNPGSVGAQSDEHNLVTVASAAGFGGTNHFQPPGAEGRFYGRRLASLFSRPFDLVRGDHRVMWMMQKAERTIILVKDPLVPFAVVVDEVERGGTGSATYEQRWTMATPVAGAGTVASPMTATNGSTTLRATYLSPAQVSVVPGSAATLSSSAITYYPNKVVASGAGPLSFVSVLHASTGIAIAPLDSPAVGTLGARLDRGTRRDRVLVATTAPGILDARTMSDGEAAWTSEIAGVLTGYALSEGTELVHDGIPLVESAEKISAAIGMGEIVVTRAVDASPGTSLPLARFLVPPGTGIGRVTVDGTPVSFVEIAGRIVIGTRTAAALAGDRFYGFTAGNAGDAVLGGGAFLTPDGRLSAGASGGRLDLRGGAATPNLPLAVAFDLELGATPNGAPAATLEFRGGGSGSVVGTITALSSPSGVVLQAGGGTLPVSAVVVPRVGTETEVRVFLRYHPRAGRVIVRDRSGCGAGTLALPPTMESVASAFVLFPASRLDDIACYDAAEDGLTPQGIVVWLGNDGRFGWALSAPSLLSTSGLGIAVNGVPVALPLVVAWAQAANFVDLIAPVGGAAPTPWLGEVAFESAVPAVPTLPGYLFGVSGVSIAGTPLLGQASFGP